MDSYVLEAVNITKRFPGVIANENVNLRIKKGEIHGLIGENGAGKSTILKILNGIYPYGTYEGDIYINGEKAHLLSTQDAKLKGIGFVPQEINVLENMSVGENLFVGDWKTGREKSIGISFKYIFAKTRDFLKENNIILDPGVRVSMLSVGQKQLLMVARALVKNPKVLILDEPTSSLTLDEVENLFKILKKLKEKGTSIIFVTHKLEEIMGVTDSVTILRDGHNICSYSKEEYNKDNIITGMVGRQITNLYPKRDTQIGEEIFRVENLTIEHPRIENRNIVENVSFSLRKGEVLGIAGLIGAGRTETLRAIYGADKRKCGKIYKNGKELHIRSVKDAISSGISMVTEDRKKDGLLFLESIKKNLVVNNFKKISKRGWVSNKIQNEHAEKYFKQMGVKAPSMETGVITLSGGNQQKVVIGRALNVNPEIILLDEPTKGVDIGAKNDVYNIINDLIAKGASIIMVSSELPELLEMCDRFIVMAEGIVVGEFSKEEVSEHKIMLSATKSKKYKTVGN